VLHALVLAAEALPVSDRAKDAGAEEAIALRLEGAVVDGLRLGDFAMRPRADFFRRRQLELLVRAARCFCLSVRSFLVRCVNLKICVSFVIPREADSSASPRNDKQEN